MWLMLKGRGLFEIHKPIARGVYFTQMLSFLVDKIELNLFAIFLHIVHVVKLKLSKYYPLSKIPI